MAVFYSSTVCEIPGEMFADAVENAIESLTDIVALRRGLTQEQCVGLFGELVVLIALADRDGPALALASWRGPAGEEHDFGLQLHDLEVKTTLSESRVHWISGMSQLMPTMARPLYLSLDSGNDRRRRVRLHTARNGWAPACTVLAVHSSRLNDLLRSCSYRDEDAALYGLRWTLRTMPAFYEVSGDFPAITPAAARLSRRICRTNHRFQVSD